MKFLSQASLCCCNLAVLTHTGFAYARITCCCNPIEQNRGMAAEKRPVNEALININGKNLGSKGVYGLNLRPDVET